MRKVLSSIKVFAFWGIVFLIILVVGFKVDIKEILSIAMSLKMYLAAFCIYFLTSIVLYPLLAIVTNLKSGISFIDTIAIGLPPILWIPYKGIDIRGLFKLKGSGLDAKGIAYDIGVYIRRFVETVLWWAVVVFGVYTIFHTENNAILQAVNEKTLTQKLIILGVAIGIYLFLQLISWVINKAVTKRWRNEGYREPSNKGTRAQQYFDRHPERIPSGCRACGGPYPECRSSCNLFDE